MSEDWHIFIVGLAISWVGWEIRHLRQALDRFVTKHDCEQDMGSHCKRLDVLESKVDKNGEDIAVLKKGYAIYHGR